MIIIMLFIIAILLLVLVLANDRAREVLIFLLYLTGRIALWALALGVVAVLVLFFIQNETIREIGIGLLGLSLILLFVWFYYKGCKEGKNRLREEAEREARERAERESRWKEFRP